MSRPDRDQHHGGTLMGTTQHVQAGSPVRPPRVGGAAGGVGTSLVAGLLGVADAGVVGPGTAVDVLVCRSTARSVRDAVALAGAAPSPVVLVVVADCGDREPRTVKQRLRMAEPNLAAVLRLPWWPTLRDLDDPDEHLARAVWGDATAVRARSERDAPRIGAALVAAVTPLLTTPDPPAPAAHTSPTTSRHVS